MLLRVLLFLYFLLCSCALKAQVPPRAQKLFEKAMLLDTKKKHQDARETMERAIAEYPAYTDAISILGAWYFNDHNFRRSAEVFRIGYGRDSKFAYPLAKSLVFAGMASEALPVIASASASSREQALWEKLRTQAVFIQQSMANPWRDTAFNMGRPNTRDAEMFPWISKDEQKLYFTRRMRNTDEDFFTTEVDSCGGWFTGTNMGSPPNSLNQEAAQMISADGHYLFFMRCENRSINGWGQGGCDLYMAYTADSIWSVPQSFGATINTPGYEGMPCLSVDNRELYFVSDREGGYGGFDIWISRFRDGLWQKPVNAGSQVNTPGNETAPFIHIDNSTFYFASDGHPGMGGSDLFMARRTGDTNWTKPLNMGYPINSTADESSLCVNIKGNKLFFASDRDSVAGNFDLYEMNLPVKLQPTPVSVVKGYVYDSLTKARLNYASIQVTDETSEEPLYRFMSNRGDGSFMITLPVGKIYQWHTDRISYKDGKAVINLLEPDTSEGPIIHNIALLPADYIAPVKDITILTILFPVKDVSLADSDKVVIAQALGPWLSDKQGLQIQVNGYTDNSGTPIINEELSVQRAGLVAQEISAMGFDPMNIQVEGWGEADPVAPNDTEENMQLNRRVEVIIRR